MIVGYSVQFKPNADRPQSDWWVGGHRASDGGCAASAMTPAVPAYRPCAYRQMRQSPAPVPGPYKSIALFDGQWARWSVSSTASNPEARKGGLQESETNRSTLMLLDTSAVHVLASRGLSSDGQKLTKELLTDSLIINLF